MMPVPSGSRSRRRSGGGFVMSNTRKSIRLRTRYFHTAGTAIIAINCPATSSMTTNPGSWTPLSRETIVEARIPTTVTRKLRTMHAIHCCDASTFVASTHHNSTVAAEAHVPGPGFTSPMPKNVAMTQAQRVLLDASIEWLIVNVRVFSEDARSRLSRVARLGGAAWLQYPSAPPDQ